MCSKPLKGFRYGETKNGKDNYIIASYEVDHIEITKSGSIVKAYDHFVSDNCKTPIFEYVEIPCGKCLECRLRYAKLWADRCMLEAQQHDKNCFITLTYDDLNIPVKKNCVNPITGEIQDYSTLVKRDLQLFFKRLRKKLGDVKIRYFASGEYSPAARPHYHMIVFGWCPDLDDPEQAVEVGSRNGNKYYSSKVIEECWPYGFNVTTKCTWETCNYVARYVVKKYPQEKNDIYKTGIEKEFITMSNRPGIGLEWFNKNNVCYATFLNQYLKTENGSLKISPNRYFDSKLDENVLKEIKEVRKHFSEEQKKMKYYQTDLPYLEALQVEAAELERRTKILKGQML